MKRLVSLLFVALIACTLVPAQTFRSAVFLHHSVGRCFWDRSSDSHLTPPTTVAKEIAAYNSRTGRGVSMTEKSFPSVNDNNWYKWEAILAGNDESMDYSAPIVILKTCYIQQQMMSSSGDIAVLQAQMRNIVRRLASRPQNFFVIWNNYPAATDGASSRAVWSAQFSIWMKDVLAKGLDSYGAFPKNVYVFDVFRKLADPVTGVCPSQYGSGGEGPGGDHPSNEAVAIVTPAFVQETFDAAYAYETGGVVVPAPTATLTANLTQLPSSGGTVVLTVATTGATSASIPGISSVPLNGQVSVLVTSSKTFVLTATGPGGTVTSQATVTVAAPPAPPPPSGAFKVGDVVRVVLTTDCVNARSAPSLTSNVLDCEKAGATGTVLAGPTVADGHTFWQVRYADGHTGWSSQKYLELVTSTPPGPVPSAPIGTLMVTKIINGLVTINWTAENDSAVLLSGIPRTGKAIGMLTVPMSRDTVVKVEISGPGGTAILTASTVSGTNLPASPDSAKIAQESFTAGFALARAKFDSVYNAGRGSVICPPVDSIAVQIKQALTRFLK